VGEYRERPAFVPRLELVLNTASYMPHTFAVVNAFTVWMCG
jgi:hypothetical protein